MVSLSLSLSGPPSFLQFISQELGVVEEDQAAPPKEQLEQEKQLLLACKPVLQKFLHDHTPLQVSALYALQVHCHASDFPKGGSHTRDPGARPPAPPYPPPPTRPLRAYERLPEVL